MKRRELDDMMIKRQLRFVAFVLKVARLNSQEVLEFDDYGRILLELGSTWRSIILMIKLPSYCLSLFSLSPESHTLLI